MCLISHTVNRSTQTFTPYDSFSSLCEPFLDKVRKLNLFGHFKTQLTSNTQHLSTVESALIPVKSTLKLSYGQNGIDTDFETEADVTVEYGYFILNPDFFKLKTLPSGTFKCRWLESQNIGCLSYEVPLNGLSTRNPTLFFFLACNQEQEWTAFYKQTDDTIVSEPLEAVLDIKRERGDEMAYNCSTQCSYCHWIQKTVKPLPTLSLPRLDTISHSKTETLRWSAREFVHYQLVLCQRQNLVLG